jgi:5'-3' exonuclease
MIEYEADDALAAAAASAARDSRVDRVIICTPDKDLSQCVRGTRIVQMNRPSNAQYPGRGRCCRQVRGAASVDTRLLGSGR